MFGSRFAYWQVFLLLFGLTCLNPGPLLAAEKAPNLDKVVAFLDQLFRSKTSISSIEMEVTTPNWERSMTMELYTAGMDKTFVRIHSPKKDKGVATLRVSAEMWNYFPKINKVMKVPPSMMMSSWMGSDFTNDDLVKETSLLADYNAKMLPPDVLNPQVLSVELTPKANTATVWGKIVILGDKDTWIPFEEVFYDEKGQAMRVMKLLEVKKFGDKTMPSVMEIVPLNKEGHKTRIVYKSAQFDIKLPEDTFSLRNLQRQQ